jgi:predicted RNA binding protein YcfA (HicA-like mRNA interferase family)
MAIHFSTPKSPLAFSSAVAITDQDFAATQDIRKLTEDVAQRILITFLACKEKTEDSLEGKRPPESALNLEHQIDPRMGLIGTQSLPQDPQFSQIFRQEQLQYLNKLLIQYPSGQHLNLPEFLGMLILESWERLRPHLPTSLEQPQDQFTQEFWRFYLTSHINITLYNHSASDDDFEEVIRNLVGAPKQWSFFKPFLTYLVNLAKEVTGLSDAVEEKHVFSKRLQLLIQLTTKCRSLFLPESLLVYYPKDYPCCRLQDLGPSLNFLSIVFQTILKNKLHSKKQTDSFQRLAQFTTRLHKLTQDLSDGSKDAQQTFSAIIDLLSQIALETHKASIDREEDLSLLTMKAKYKDERAACVFDISSYKIFLQIFKGVIAASEHSGFYYPYQSLVERIVSTISVTLVAEESSITIDSRLVTILPEWEAVLRDCYHLNLENDKKNLDFGLRILKLSDASQLYCEHKRPFFELYAHQQYLRSHETSKFVEKIKQIHAKAQGILSNLPLAFKTPATQNIVNQELQVALTLKFLEFYLHRDMEHLIHNNNLIVTDYIPDEFFDLLSLQIPLETSFESLEDDMPEHFDSSLILQHPPLQEPKAILEHPAIAPVATPVDAKPKATSKLPPKPDSPTFCKEAMIASACKDIQRARKFRQIEKILNSLHLYASMQTGSHAIFTSPSGAKVVVPKHPGKDLKTGTLSSISRQAFTAAHEPP